MWGRSKISLRFARDVQAVPETEPCLAIGAEAEAGKALDGVYFGGREMRLWSLEVQRWPVLNPDLICRVVRKIRNAISSR